MSGVSGVSGEIEVDECWLGLVRVRVSRCFSSTRQLAKNLQRWAKRVQ